MFVKGSEDVGALPSSFATTFTITNTTPALVAGANTLSATVDHTDAVRMVEFLVDGLPAGIVYSAPYSVPYTSDGSPHTVIARAYAAWATQTLVAEGTGTGGTGTGGIGSAVAPTNAKVSILVH